MVDRPTIPQIPSVMPLQEGTFQVPINRWTRNPDGTPDIVDRTLYTHPLFQATKAISESLYEPDPDFDWKSKLPGYERHVYEIAKIRSEKEWLAWKERVDTLEQYRRDIADNGTIATGLVAGAVDPINWLPIPLLKGMGFWKGAAYGAATNIAVQTPISGIGLLADPTTTITDEMESIAYAGIFGGLIGGVVGGLKSREIANKAIQEHRAIEENLASINAETPVSRQARDVLDSRTRDLSEPSTTPKPGDSILNADARTYGGSDNSVRGRVGLDGPSIEVPLPTDRPGYEGGLFEPRGGRGGLAPAKGLENVIGHWGPYMRLESRGSQALSDIGHALAGDFGVAQRGNLEGLPTAQSAYLNAGRWGAMAVDVQESVKKYWLNSKGYKEAKTIAGYDVTAMVARAEDKIESYTQKRDGIPTDASVKLAEHDFSDAVTRSHLADKIEVPNSANGKVLDDETKSSVRDAVSAVRKFFDYAKNEGVQTGAIKTAESLRRNTEHKLKEVTRFTQELNDLMKKKTLSANDQAKSDAIKVAIKDITDELHINVVNRHVTDETIANTIDKIEDAAQARVAKSKNLIEQIESSIQSYFDKMVAIRNHLIKIETEIGLTKDQSKTLKNVEKAILDIEDDWTLAKTQRQKEVISAARETIYDKGFTPRMERFYTDLLKKIRREDIEFSGPKSEQFYLPRYWQLDKILSNQDGLVQQIQKWLQDQDQYLPNAEARRQAQQTVDHLIFALNKEVPGADVSFQKSARYSFQKNRTLEIPNEYVFDFINTDINDIMNMYARDAGIAIEYARMFGDANAKHAINKAMIVATGDLTGSYNKISKTIAQSRLDAEDLRKSAQHRLTSEHPLTVSETAVRTLKNLTALQLLGKVVFTSIPESASVLFQNGIAGFRPLFDILTDSENLKGISRQYKLVTGEALDLASAMGAQRFVEVERGMNGRTGSATALAAERLTRGFNKFSETTFYAANGLAAWTDFVKTWNMLQSTHFHLDDIRKIATGTADSKTKFRMNAYGIGLDEAKRINAAWGGKTNQSGKLNIADISSWEDPGAVRAFANMLSGHSRRMVVTSGPADKTLLQQGFVRTGDAIHHIPILKLSTQLMTYGIAATQKFVVSGIQGRDAHFMMRAMGMIGMTYLALHLRSSAFGRMEWKDQMALTIDRSGVLGAFSDLNNLLESGSKGNFGMRPLFGLNPPYNIPYEDGGGVASAFGPAGSKISDLYKIYTDPYMTQNEKYSVIRRSIPLNNLFYLDGLFKQTQKAFMD